MDFFLSQDEKGQKVFQERLLPLPKEDQLTLEWPSVEILKSLIV